MKTLGLDLGTRTVGIAISDALGMMAHGVEPSDLKKITIKKQFNTFSNSSKHIMFQKLF